MNELWTFLNENNISINFKDIPVYLTCCICCDVMKNATVSTCGCSFCNKCIYNFLKEETKLCPGCIKEDLKTNLIYERDIGEDIKANKEISKIKVKCPYTECNELVDFIVVVEHMNKCTLSKYICIFKDVGCTVTKESEDEMNQHINDADKDHLKLLSSSLINFNEMKSVVEEKRSNLNDEIKTLANEKLKIANDKKQLLTLTNDYKILLMELNKCVNDDRTMVKLKINDIDKNYNDLLKLKLSLHGELLDCDRNDAVMSDNTSIDCTEETGSIHMVVEREFLEKEWKHIEEERRKIVEEMKDYEVQKNNLKQKITQLEKLTHSIEDVKNNVEENRKCLEKERNQLEEVRKIIEFEKNKLKLTGEEVEDQQKYIEAENQKMEDAKKIIAEERKNSEKEKKVNEIERKNIEKLIKQNEKANKYGISEKKKNEEFKRIHSEQMKTLDKEKKTIALNKKEIEELSKNTELEKSEISSEKNRLIEERKLVEVNKKSVDIEMKYLKEQKNNIEQTKKNIEEEKNLNENKMKELYEEQKDDLENERNIFEINKNEVQVLYEKMVAENKITLGIEMKKIEQKKKIFEKNTTFIKNNLTNIKKLRSTLGLERKQFEKDRKDLDNKMKKFLLDTEKFKKTSKIFEGEKLKLIEDQNRITEDRNKISEEKKLIEEMKNDLNNKIFEANEGNKEIDQNKERLSEDRINSEKERKFLEVERIQIEKNSRYNKEFIRQLEKKKIYAVMKLRLLQSERNNLEIMREELIEKESKLEDSKRQMMNEFKEYDEKFKELERQISNPQKRRHSNNLLALEGDSKQLKLDEDDTDKLAETVVFYKKEANLTKESPRQAKDQFKWTVTQLSRSPNQSRCSQQFLLHGVSMKLGLNWSLDNSLQLWLIWSRQQNSSPCWPVLERLRLRVTEPDSDVLVGSYDFHTLGGDHIEPIPFRLSLADNEALCIADSVDVFAEVF